MGRHDWCCSRCSFTILMHSSICIHCNRILQNVFRSIFGICFSSLYTAVSHEDGGSRNLERHHGVIERGRRRKLAYAASSAELPRAGTLARWWRRAGVASHGARGYCPERPHAAADGAPGSTNFLKIGPQSLELGWAAMPSDVCGFTMTTKSSPARRMILVRRQTAPPDSSPPRTTLV